MFCSGHNFCHHTFVVLLCHLERHHLALLWYGVAEGSGRWREKMSLVLLMAVGDGGKMRLVLMEGRWR